MSEFVPVSTNPAVSEQAALPGAAAAATRFPVPEQPRIGTGTIAEAYGRRASEYIAAVGKIEHAEIEDRDYLLAWARGIHGRLLDVGCGPGQWTNLFREAGLDVSGLDPTEACIADAAERYPRTRYRLGRAEDLDVESRSLGGVLAWYSLIHTEPSAIDAPFEEFARALAPGGGLVLGFFAGPRCEPFDHAITTAYSWPISLLVERVERAGFSVVDTRVRESPGGRPEGLLAARRD